MVIYLSDQFQYVDTDGLTSSLHPFICGVPHRAILGPLLYLINANEKLFKLT